MNQSTIQIDPDTSSGTPCDLVNKYLHGESFSIRDKEVIRNLSTLLVHQHTVILQSYSLNSILPISGTKKMVKYHLRIMVLLQINMKAWKIFVFGLQNKIRVHTQYQYERVIEVLAICDNMFENQCKNNQYSQINAFGIDGRERLFQ